MFNSYFADLGSLVPIKQLYIHHCLLRGEPAKNPPVAYILKKFLANFLIQISSHRIG